MQAAIEKTGALWYDLIVAANARGVLCTELSRALVENRARGWEACLRATLSLGEGAAFRETLDEHALGADLDFAVDQTMKLLMIYGGRE